MTSAILVFSHLRWDFPYRRPQHLLLRLAAHFPIVFVEEPVHHATRQTFFSSHSPAPNILVCRPHTPLAVHGFHDGQLPYLRELLRTVMDDYDEHIVWFYAPMALPLLSALQPRLVVYDCMGEDGIGNKVSGQWRQREHDLLTAADIVFTRSPALYRAKCAHHPDAHCFPDGVDVDHFLPALDRANSHPAHRNIPGPRLGFYGVIDRCFDTALVARLADAHPQWQIVLVGPVVDIDPARLPRRSNIHYLGQQSYQALPLFLAGWDVGLLPFAPDEENRLLCSSMTLEYMAAALPIVSTPVADVMEMYGDTVAVAADAPAFVAACEAALLASPQEQKSHLEKMRTTLAASSWDATAERMRTLLGNRSRRPNESGTTPRSGQSAAISRLRRHEEIRYANTAIIGAGPTGLSAAYHLGHDALLLEKEAMVGGGCRSIREDGFIFDCAGDIMFSGDPYVLAMYELLLGSNLHWQECRMGWYGNGTQGRSLPGVLPRLPSAQMETAWPGGGVLLPNPDRSSSGGSPPPPPPPSVRLIGPHRRFGYPLRGGLQALVSGFVPHIKGTVERNAEVVAVSPGRHMIMLADGRRYEYRRLISTMPLPQLVQSIGDEVPLPVRAAALALRHDSLRCINLGIAREKITDRHWIHYPEGTVFHRIFVQGNASVESVPQGGFGLSCEIRYAPARHPLPVAGRDLIERCVRECIDVGLLHDHDRILAAHEVDMPFAHVIDDRTRADNVDTIAAWLAAHDILIAGRYGAWESDNANHAFVAGRKAAEAVCRVGPRCSTLATR